MSFFLKPLSVTLPYAARFTDGETTSRARERIQYPAKAETVTVTKKGEVAALARFSISLPTVGSVSDQRAADGEGEGRRQKKANEDNQTSIPPFFRTFPGVCGKLAPKGHLLRPAGVNFPQSPANQFSRATKLC
jgi:hypothetical protein